VVFLHFLKWCAVAAGGMVLLVIAAGALMVAAVPRQKQIKHEPQQYPQTKVKTTYFGCRGDETGYYTFMEKHIALLKTKSDPSALQRAADTPGCTILRAGTPMERVGVFLPMEWAVPKGKLAAAPLAISSGALGCYRAQGSTECYVTDRAVFEPETPIKKENAAR
jgi:hypothetical protein